MATKQMKRYNVLLTKQTACKNYCILNKYKLESDIAYGNVMNELDALTVFFVKKLKLQEKI